MSAESERLPAGWQCVRAEQIVPPIKGMIVSGPFGSNIGKKFFVDSGIPVIRGNNLTLGEKELLDTGYVFLTEEKAHELRNCEAVEGDIVFTAAGTLGQVGRIPENAKFPRYIISNKQLRIRPDPSISDSRYLYYWFSSPGMRAFILNQNTGASIPLITLSTLRSLPINLPPLPVQRRIASILSAYDDLIENNQRRIHVLEDMARALYHEWFVEFRFPGHEAVPLVDSSLGKIPEGWEVKSVKDTFEILGGGTPSKKIHEYWENGTINWYTPTDLTSSDSMFMDRSGMQITQLGLNKSSAKLFPPFSVMMTSRATLGVISINTTEASTNQGFISCLPNPRFPLYTLYHWLQENVDVFISLGSGATFKEITKGVFKDIKVLVPGIKMVTRFEKVVAAFGEQALTLQRKNQNLRRTRDLLLPRLLSGQLDVSKVEQEHEIAA